MQKKLLPIIIALVAIAALALALPISNYFLPRSYIECQSESKEFQKVSQIMQNKCVDCHTPGMESEPIYAHFPFAEKLINDDITAAQQEIIFEKEVLSGKKTFSKLQAARIQTVVENNEMPILPYKLLHWNAALSAEDRESFIDWIKSQYGSNSAL